MKTFKFDQFEFDPSDSEQEVEIFVSTAKDARHGTLAKFADDVCKDGASGRLGNPVAFCASPMFDEQRVHLKLVANIDVARDCAWSCYVVSDEWDYRQILLDTGSAFISYRWSTTA